MRVAAGVVVATLALGAVAGCSSDRPLHLVVDPGPVPVDDTGSVVLHDARPGQPVTITARAVDGDGTTWSATATYTADGAGTVDTARTAPDHGDYDGVHATGLLFSLTAGDDHLAFVTENGTLSVTYRVAQDERRTDTARQERDVLVAGVTVTETDLTRDGIVGTLYEPADPARHTASVVVLGGSEGGNGASRSVAALLAAHGHPALALAYFNAPGLPHELVDVPVEYVGRALRWLAARPGVDRRRLVVEGASRGSELALLTALHYPGLVHGVVVTSTTSFVNTGYPSTDEAPFTWQGRAVPHASVGDFGRVEPSDPAADIDVARIHAPMLLVCGDDDQLWPSCPSSERIVATSPGLPRTLVREPGAGHLVDFLVPGLPLASTEESTPTSILEIGGTVQADAIGRLDALPRMLTFLADLN